MPKVKSESIRVRTDKTDIRFDVSIFYLESIGFYIPIPGDYKDKYGLLSDELKRGLKALDNPYNRRGNLGPIVAGESLSDVSKLFQTLMIELVKLSSVVRKVILVWYNGTFEESDFGGKIKPIVTSFEFVYCEEITTEGQKPKYYSSREYTAFGEQRIDKTEVHLTKGFSCFSGYGHKDATVIDDTPENRAFLENIYKTFGALNTALTKVLGSPKNLLEAVGKKLLLTDAMK